MMMMMMMITCKRLSHLSFNLSHCQSQQCRTTSCSWHWNY